MPTARTPLLYDFPSVTDDHSLSTSAAPASWEGARIRVTGSGAGEGSLYLVEAGGMRIVIWGRAPAGTLVPAATAQLPQAKEYLPAGPTAQCW